LLYFDHNATTIVAPEVADVFDRAVREVFGNASSTHRSGQLAREGLESARKTIAAFVGAPAAQIVFTSGGTEANNLALFGLARSVGHGHIVTSAIEHPSVLECCRQLEREAFELSVVPVDRDGVLDPAAVERAITAQTLLVSIMHANNETGAVQPIEQITRLVQDRRGAGQQIYLHSDGVQALGKMQVNVDALGIDLYSMSAHKVFAPKGIGALYVRRTVPLRGVQFGGKHERERRAGTENVPGAIAFACALDLCCEDRINLAELRDEFESELMRRLPGVEIQSKTVNRLPNTSNVLFRGIAADALVIALDMKGIAVSTGSACSSGSIEPSQVLLAMGLTREEAKSTVRFSFGRYNTQKDIETLADAVVTCAGRLRVTQRMEAELVQH
jgi:cysteine desulfurase